MFSTSNFIKKKNKLLFFSCWINFSIKLLIKLCQHTCTSDELVDADSLKLLFKIVASTCESHNIAWRQTAADALLTLTKNFNSKAINYIHRNINLFIFYYN